MNHHLLNLVLALAAADVLHNLIEQHTVRQKVEWLRLTLAGKKYKDLPFQVTSRLHSYAFSLFGLAASTAVFYLIASVLDLSPSAGLWATIALLVVAHGVLAVFLDKYHVEIGAVTNPLMKNV